MFVGDHRNELTIPPLLRQTGQGASDRTDLADLILFT